MARGSWCTRWLPPLREGDKPVTQVSSQYGDPAIWPGDTFGISVLPGGNGPGAPEHVALSWGSAVGGSQNSEIYATVVGR